MEVDEIMLKSQQAIFKLLEKREPVVLVGENDMSILELMPRQSDSVVITMFPKLNEKEISEVNYEVSIKLACSYIQIKLEMEKYLCFDLIQFIHEVNNFQEHVTQERKKESAFVYASDLKEMEDYIRALFKGEI
jgi:hypothetical protein